MQIIGKCNEIAKRKSVIQRQRYTKVSKELIRQTHNGNYPKNRKMARATTHKIGTIAARLVRELECDLDGEQREKYADTLELLNRALLRDRNQKDKVYSIHKPHTACIAKCKADHIYELGNKVRLISTANSQVILVVMAFPDNPNDSKTIQPLTAQLVRNGLKLPERIAYDRGGRGPKVAEGVEIITPGRPKCTDTAYERAKKRQSFRRRAAVEPLIGHLKSDNRIKINYLWKEISSSINAMLSAAAWNLKKLMKKLAKELLRPVFNMLTFCIPFIPCAHHCKPSSIGHYVLKNELLRTD